MSEKLPNPNNNGDENEDTTSRTLEENSDHLIDKTLTTVVYRVAQ
jgi:hypothetical protein